MADLKRKAVTDDVTKLVFPQRLYGPRIFLSFLI